MNKRELGDCFETKACVYLQNSDYEIIKRNFRSRHGEIDIIAKDKDTLVFIEVKYRTDNNKGFPEEAVTFQKQKTIINTARVFLMLEHLKESTPCRFDVIAYYYDGSFKHFINAFGS